PAIIVTLLICIFFEFYSTVLSSDPNGTGVYIIFIFLAIVMYFSFRDGVVGGVWSTIIALLYFAYIVITRGESRADRREMWELILLLGLLYFALSLLIGWLKQTIDKLIEREANEKIRLQSIIEQLPVGVII